MARFYEISSKLGWPKIFKNLSCVCCFRACSHILPFCGHISKKMSKHSAYELILQSLRAVLGPSCRRLGPILQLFWGYLHQFGQPKRHFGLAVGQLVSILASGGQSSRMGMNGADLHGAMQPGPAVLPPLILVPLAPCWG